MVKRPIRSRLSLNLFPKNRLPSKTLPQLRVRRQSRHWIRSPQYRPSCRKHHLRKRVQFRWHRATSRSRLPMHNPQRLRTGSSVSCTTSSGSSRKQDRRVAKKSTAGTDQRSDPASGSAPASKKQVTSSSVRPRYSEVPNKTGKSHPKDPRRLDSSRSRGHYGRRQMDLTISGSAAKG